MIKTVFFDTNGTLYDSEEFDDAQSKRAVMMLAERKNIPLDNAKVLFKEKEAELKSRMQHVAKAHVLIEFGISRNEWQEYLSKLNPAKFLVEDKELEIIISGLSKKYYLGILSNVTETFVVNILNTLKLNPAHFKYMVTSDNTIESKPHEEPFLKAIELSGNEPRDVVYVGDSYTKDIVPALRAGMKTIWVTDEKDKKESTECIGNIRQIGQGLERLSAKF